MKYFRILFLAIAVAVAPVSCKSPERAALNAVQVSKIGVKEAVAIFRLQVKEGRVSADQIVLADKMLEAWKSASVSALEALKQYQRTGDSTQWDRAVLVSAQAYAALVKVLAPFVKELQTN